MAFLHFNSPMTCRARVFEHSSRALFSPLVLDESTPSLVYRQVCTCEGPGALCSNTTQGPADRPVARIKVELSEES